MKITIDTKEDSHEDIKKVIRMLQHLVGSEPVTNQPDLFGDSSRESTSSNVFGNIFDDTKPQSTDESKELPKEEPPEIIPY